MSVWQLNLNFSRCKTYIYSYITMNCRERVRRAYVLDMALQQVDQINLHIHQHTHLHIHHLQGRGRRQRGQRRQVWQQLWLSRRKQFGINDQLLVELRKEDQKSFRNFMRMPMEMYDEILQRIQHRIAKQHTWYQYILVLCVFCLFFY